MGKIKDWISNIGYWLSELSGVWLVLSFAIISSLILGGASALFGKKYSKFHPNNYTYEWAEHQYQRLFADNLSEDSGDGTEYYDFYDSRGQAINDFMILARMLDGKYANGKFRHWYLPLGERIYQCHDKDRKLIAVRFVKHQAGIWSGYWDERKPYYEVDFYVEDKRED